jgi:RNA polymerase sigma-70 factor (ECF subfamily)
MKQAYAATDPEDRKVINGMIRDMEYAVKWMESGRDPKRNHMDAERKRVYYYDPAVLGEIGQVLYPTHWEDDSENEARVNNFFGACLTRREEDVYRLYVGEGLSMAKIAELLHIAKTSVQNLVERSEKKVDVEKKQVRLF